MIRTIQKVNVLWHYGVGEGHEVDVIGFSKTAKGKQFMVGRGMCVVKRESVKQKDSLSVQVRHVMYPMPDHNSLGVFDDS